MFLKICWNLFLIQFWLIVQKSQEKKKKQGTLIFVIVPSNHPKQESSLKCKEVKMKMEHGTDFSRTRCNFSNSNLGSKLMLQTLSVSFHKNRYTQQWVRQVQTEAAVSYGWTPGLSLCFSSQGWSRKKANVLAV